MEAYPKELIERRTSLVMDDVECIAKFLRDNYPADGKLFELMSCLSNIEIALDFNDDESDNWKFYPDGSRAHLNK